MTAARRLPTAKAAPGAHHNHISAFPARTLSPAAGPASRSFVQPGAPPLTPAPPPACLESSREPGEKGHTQTLDRPRSFRDDLLHDSRDGRMNRRLLDPPFWGRLGHTPTSPNLRLCPWP